MGARGEQAVGAAQHRVLLVQDHAQAAMGPGQDRGHAGVAAEADHGVGPEAPQDAPGLEIADGQAADAAQLLEQAAAGQGPGVDPLGLDLGQVGAEAAAGAGP